MKPLKVGVLMPGSNFIPAINKGIFAGLEMGLRENKEIPYEIIMEPAGYNADKKVVMEKMQSLVMQKQADIVVAPLNYGLLPHVRDMFISQEVPLLINTLGEDVWFNETKSPFLFSNTLHLWQSAWLLGKWAGDRFGKKGGFIAGMHDGGYGISLSIAIGTEAAGGSIIHTAVTHLKTRTDDCSAEIKRVAEQKPDFIAAFYSGKEAVSFLRTYQETGYWGKIPLVGLPFMIDPEILEQAGEELAGIQSVHCWQEDGENSANIQFVKKMKDETGRKAHCYSLLAYESGHLIAKAMKEVGDAKVAGKKLAEALPHISYDGPRGKISFNKETRELITEQFLVESAKGTGNKLYNKTIQKLEIPGLLDEHYALGCKNLQKHGWLNPYLCA